MNVEGDLTEADLASLCGGDDKMVLMLSCALRSRTDGTRKEGPVTEFVRGGLVLAADGEMYVVIGAVK